MTKKSLGKVEKNPQNFLFGNNPDYGNEEKNFYY